MNFYSDIITKKETIQTNLLVNMSTVLFMHFSLYYNIEMYSKRQKYLPLTRRGK